MLLFLRQSAASDFNIDIGLIIVGGELCTDIIWCNDFTDKTLLSKDGGTTFEELSPFPALGRGLCGVFIDNTTFMVIGGYKFPTSYYAATYLLSINNDNLDESTWGSGPPLTVGRAYHTCNVVTDCAGKRQVVVVGGYAGSTSDYTNSVEIYDIDSGAWSQGIFSSLLINLCQINKPILSIEGSDFPHKVYEHGSAYYQDSFVIVGGYGTRDGSSSAEALNAIY